MSFNLRPNPKGRLIELWPLATGGSILETFCLRKGSRRFTRGAFDFQVQETPSAFHPLAQRSDKK
jgi:hypothetical protein